MLGLAWRPAKVLSACQVCSCTQPRTFPMPRSWCSVMAVMGVPVMASAVAPLPLAQCCHLPRVPHASLADPRAQGRASSYWLHVQDGMICQDDGVQLGSHVVRAVASLLLGVLGW